MTLTPREQQIYDLAEKGLRNRQIATELKIAEGTVKIHLRNMRTRSFVPDRPKFQPAPRTYYRINDLYQRPPEAFLREAAIRLSAIFDRKVNVG